MGEQPKASRGVKARIIKAATAVATQLKSNLSASGDEFIRPPTNSAGYEVLVDNSTILPQCVFAYKNNIAGFGIGVKYINEDEEETTEKKAEWEQAEEILKYLNLDKDTKEVFEDIVSAREIFGISYSEILRNGGGEIVGMEFIADTPSITKTKPLEPYIEVEYRVGDRVEKRPRRFRKYRQEVNGKNVFFKELGDTRIMDKRSGKYSDTVPFDYRANEILEFAIGTGTYGKPRWIGQVLGADGARRAENLNNRYFTKGRHTPLLVAIEGGTLTDDSFDKLQEYMGEIEGESGQHAFIILETASLDSKAEFQEDNKPKVNIHPLANMLQKDELFQDYQDNHRRRVQSSFLLPDIYVGHTAEYNRATAQAAREITEEQVFQPARQSLAWTVNNKLLAEYGFKHVEAYFKAPDLSNIDDIVKILAVSRMGGGLTPNKAKELTYKALGGTAEEYDGDWGNIPLEVRKLPQASQVAMGLIDESLPNYDALTRQLDGQIAKSAKRGDGEISVVLKEVRNLLRENAEKSLTNPPECIIIKDEDGNSWITINGARVQVDGDGNLMGEVGAKIDATSAGDVGGGDSSGSASITQQDYDNASTYTTNAFTEINTGLRAGTELTRENKSAVEALDKIIENSPNLEEDSMLYRGMPTSVLGISGDTNIGSMSTKDFNALKNGLIGGTYDDQAFTSTTTNRNTAAVFTGYENNRGVEMRITCGKNARGVSSANFSVYGAKESEVILPRNSTMQITGVSRSMGRLIVSATYGD